MKDINTILNDNFDLGGFLIKINIIIVAQNITNMDHPVTNA